MRISFDYVELWRALQIYHRGNAATRLARLDGYLALKARTLEPPRAQRYLRRFIERERSRQGPR